MTKEIRQDIRHPRKGNLSFHILKRKKNEKTILGLYITIKELQF